MAVCRSVFLTLFICSLVIAKSRAQVSEQRITLPEAIDLFGQHNLSLHIARSTSDEWSARILQASAYPNPAVQILHEPLSNNGESISETYFNLSQQIEWPAIRNARMNAARQLATSARARFKSDSLSLVFDLAKTFVKVVAAENQLISLRQVTEIFRKAHADARTQFDIGEISAYRLQRLKVERARYENRLAAAELALLQMQRKLGTILTSGTSSKRYLPEYTLVIPPSPPSINSLLARARTNRPEYVEATSNIAAARFTVTETEKSLIPSPLLTTGYKRQSNGFSGLFLGAQFDVPVFDRKLGDVFANRTRVHQAETYLLLIEQRIEQEVAEALDIYTSYHERHLLISESLLDEADLLLESARISYNEGEMDLIELLDAADAFYDAQQATIILLSDAVIAYYDLMRSVGHIPIH